MWPEVGVQCSLVCIQCARVDFYGIQVDQLPGANHIQINKYIYFCHPGLCHDVSEFEFVPLLISGIHSLFFIL